MATGVFTAPAQQFRFGHETRHRPFAGTPEIFFYKPIDNSRLVKVADPRRKREMAQFLGSMAMLFLLVMMYVLQHFSAIEYGYKIEQAKATHDGMVEMNRALRVEHASLRSPDRIDALARDMGLQAPLAGQVQQMEAPAGDMNAPVMASATGLSVVSMAR